MCVCVCVCIYIYIHTLYYAPKTISPVHFGEFMSFPLAPSFGQNVNLRTGLIRNKYNN